MGLAQSSNQSDISDHSAPKTLDDSYPLNLPVTTRHATEDDNPDEESICRECREVDWDVIPTLAENWLQQGIFQNIRIMEADYEQLATSPCKICRILSTVMRQYIDNPQCTVEARSVLDFYAYSLPYRWMTSNNVTALHVCPRNISGQFRCLVAIKRDIEGFRSRMITPRSIDYGWLKGLARMCEEAHECKPGSLGPVPGLKVIEVSSRTVVKAPTECRYVALSYVWGQQPDAGEALHLQRSPPLIEDAISVTIAMGYKYLWVDRYCIPQTNNHERHDMINRMDQIYANASLTIIDASGGGAERGLPGVSSSARRPQKCVLIRNTAIFELPCGDHELKSSKWVTRGWTYQEGYFSTRRLIFTPRQVLFHCNEHYQEESVYRLFHQDNPWYETNTKFGHLIPHFDTRKHISSDLLDQVEEYSKRNLTYQNDSLNAFLGVLNFYTQKTLEPASAFVHIAWGMLVRKSKCEELPNKTADDKTSDSPRSRWAGMNSEKDGLFVYLNWYHEDPAARRPEFPSWTWPGWAGPLTIKGEGIPLPKRGNGSSPLPRLEWEVSLKSENHQMLNLWDLADNMLKATYTEKLHRRQQPIHYKQLHITCLVVPMHFQEVSLNEAQGGQRTKISLEDENSETTVKRTSLPRDTVAVVQLCRGIYIAASPYLDQNLDAQSEVIGLLFSRIEKSGISRFGCLLARQLDEGLYERVGAIPDLVAFVPDPLSFEQDGSGLFRISWPRNRFVDEAGIVLGKVTVPAMQKELPFDGVGERRTIVLV